MIVNHYFAVQHILSYPVRVMKIYPLLTRVWDQLVNLGKPGWLMGYQCVKERPDFGMASQVESR